MKTMKAVFLVSLIIVISGCVSTKVIKEESALDVIADQYKGRNVTLYILDNFFTCTLKELRNGELTLCEDSSGMTIPGECVTQIRIDSGGRGTKGMMIGGMIGGALGFAGGWLVAREASESDANAIGHPISLGLMVGGAGAGMILGAGSKTIRQYHFSSPAKPYILHDEVGEDITPAEIKLFSVFDDLKTENTQLLLVRIIQYGDNRFLLLYDIASNGEYITKIEKVDENYLNFQKEKIKKVLSSGGN